MQLGRKLNSIRIPFLLLPGIFHSFIYAVGESEVSRSVVDLWCPERWSSALGVPYQLVLLIQSAAFVGNRNDLRSVRDLLSRNSDIVSWDPEEWGRRVDRWWEICAVGDRVLIQVVCIKETMGYEAA